MSSQAQHRGATPGGRVGAAVVSCVSGIANATLQLVAWIAAITLCGFTATALAAPESPVVNGVELLTRSLPVGWTLVDRHEQQYPYGHHYCKTYKGPTGTKLTLAGPKAVSVQWTTESGEERSTRVAVESIELWLMPGAYKDTTWAWLCLHRPVQPNHVLDTPELQVYGRTSHRLDQPGLYAKEVLPKASSIRWPSSPATDPSLISWAGWSADVASVLARVK